MHKFFSIFLNLILILMTSCSKETADNKSVIEGKLKGYVEAYNKHDSKTVASFWAENAEYVNPETGETIQGRAAIENAFQERFNEFKDSNLSISTKTILFPGKDQAVVTGTFHVKHGANDDLTSAFKAFYEKQNDQWLIVKVRDVDIAKAPDQYQHLKELEWLIGDWVDQDDDVEIHSSNHWNESKNLIMGKFSVVTEGNKELEGTQIIAFDPVNNQIRSWMFDSDGGFGESKWNKKENVWVVESSQVLASVETASSVNVFTPVDANSYKWESTDRVVSGVMLPDIDSVLITRVNGGAKS